MNTKLLDEKTRNKEVIMFLLEDFLRKLKRKNILPNLLFAFAIIISFLVIGEIENLTNKNEVKKGNLIINTKFENNIKEEKEEETKEIQKEEKENITKKTNENIYSLININSASSEVLQSLNGIGESYAEKIIAYRNEHGDFKSIEELKNVKGIGDAKFNKIKKYIEV